MNKNRVIVAMSGGVDSSVAAALLVERGYEVIGITMKTWGFMEVGGAPKYESGCCSLDAIFDAKSVAAKLGIPHYTVDFTGAFEKSVINNFVEEYLNGRTPNPCVLCNRKIKWEELLKKADSLDAYYVATGHYARTFLYEKTNRFALQRSADDRKDQTYALWGLTQESLSRTLMPLGDFTKTEIRKLAEKYELKTANKPDSQEICFVPDNDYARFLKEKAPEKINAIPEGDLIYHGKVIGKHRGYPFYTIGQRKGLGVAIGKPLYVKRIDRKNNIVEVADKEEIGKQELTAGEVNLVAANALRAGQNVWAKIRYSDKASPAKITKATGKNFSLKFEQPKNAITPGQSVVLYDESGIVLAGGIIEN